MVDIITFISAFFVIGTGIVISLMSYYIHTNLREIKQGKHTSEKQRDIEKLNKEMRLVNRISLAMLLFFSIVLLTIMID